MDHEILSVAVFTPLAGQEIEALATVRELSSVLAEEGYSRDVLYRGPEGEYVLVRFWKSDEARRAALEDPEAQRQWAKLAHQIRILKVHESLEEVPLQTYKSA
jgi:heme-degrading monooxygenase HmoA